jgi:hypothetical protein
MPAGDLKRRTKPLDFKRFTREVERQLEEPARRY